MLVPPRVDRVSAFEGVAPAELGVGAWAPSISSYTSVADAVVVDAAAGRGLRVWFREPTLLSFGSSTGGSAFEFSLRVEERVGVGFVVAFDVVGVEVDSLRRLAERGDSIALSFQVGYAVYHPRFDIAFVSFLCCWSMVKVGLIIGG